KGGLVEQDTRCALRCLAPTCSPPRFGEGPGEGFTPSPNPNLLPTSETERKTYLPVGGAIGSCNTPGRQDKKIRYKSAPKAMKPRPNRASVRLAMNMLNNTAANTTT